jgi:hypothetical protein
VIAGSSLTQALGAATLSGVIAVSGTNLNVQRPVEAFAVQEVVNPVNVGDTLAAITTKAPTRISEVRLTETDLNRSDSRWRSYVLQRIGELRKGTGDFTGLRKPSALVVDRAWLLATVLFRSDTPTPSVIPSEDGEVLYVWHKAGWDLEISVGSEEIAVWAYDRNGGTTFSGSFAEERARLLDLLGFLAWH